MRKIFVFCIILTCFSCKNNSSKKQAKSNEFLRANTQIYRDFKNYKELDTLSILEIERHFIDLDGDNIKDTIIFENLKDLVGDPQLYSILRIVLASNREFVIKDVAGFKIDSSTNVLQPNKLKSELLYLADFQEYKNLLFIWDYQYPDCTTKFEILKFDKSGINFLFNDNVIVKNIDYSKVKKSLILEGRSDCDESQKTLNVDLN